jgi:hypothetical protein
VPCRVWRACGEVRAVMFAQCAVVAAVRDVVRACGACVCVLCVRVRCAVRGLLVCGVLGDTHLALTCRCGGWGLSRRVSARACAWCDRSGERGAGRHVCEVCIGPSRM